MKKINSEALNQLKNTLEGDLYFDETMRILYSTDASAFREMPLAVAIPKSEKDIKLLIAFASEYQSSIIPRTAGTSLAGQVVGNGIIVDVSKHFTKILEISESESTATVQAGVIRDELNHHLKSHGLYYGPETSTANRAMIGGMVGNNSCGANSIVYGSARENLVEIEGFLSDGSHVVFRDLTKEEFEDKCSLENLEGKLYRQIQAILSDKKNQTQIKEHFPKPSIPRRNTGYALDLLLGTNVFSRKKKPFNFCALVAGSEGTLVFITKIKVKLHPLPYTHQALICAHFKTIDESLRANLLGLEHKPYASELIDHYILECTKRNREQNENRFFVKGNPGAILVIALAKKSEAILEKSVQKVIEDLKENNLGYHFPVVKGGDMKKVWDLRKAGLGLLSNLPGDAKPAPVIEDTAVDVADLPEFIREFNLILDHYNLPCVHYAHAGSGELHLRPILNLKTEEGNAMFRTIATEIATLVKKYKGSLSGEHGDGRLRGEFIPFMIGEDNYQLLKQVKYTWDEHGIFNPNKIVDTPKMNESLRYVPEQITLDRKTVFDFSKDQGVQRAAELCNGSGDCRKLPMTGGTMCPSYMATKEEKHTTRARANIVREVLTASDASDALASDKVYEVMDLCLSCKGCKSECPSNVDIAKIKGEFLQAYYDQNGVPFRSKMFASFTKSNELASKVPKLYNFFMTNSFTSAIAKSIMGIAPERSIPLLHQQTLRAWFKKHKKQQKKLSFKNGKVYFFCDEFTNYNDTDIGIKTILLLNKLGYEVIIPKHLESGRTYLSKGLLREAKKLASANVNLLANVLSEESPLIGVEPSAILTFRDEYIDLLENTDKRLARKVAEYTFTVDEFLANELKKEKFDSSFFTEKEQVIKLHGHCHQKALSSLVPMKKILSLPKNYNVQLIPSGCCGMAGSFGYEKEHYNLSMEIGNLVLFPTVKKQAENVIIAAPGTSCRHQIKDGTAREALHPVQILWEALKK